MFYPSPVSSIAGSLASVLLPVAASKQQPTTQSATFTPCGVRK